MINKYYVFVKKFIKENYKFLIALAIFIFLSTFTLDYEVYTPGGIIDVDKRISVENAKESKGSFNLTYVGGKKGTIPIILLSYIIPSWDLESVKDLRIENESIDDIIFRNKIDMKNTDQNAIIAAFNSAGMKYNISSQKYFVILVLNDSKTNLQVGDEILKVNNKDIINCDDCLKKFEEHSIVEILVNRNGKEILTKTTVTKIDGEPKLGIYISEYKEVSTNPKVTFKYKKNESGASGGLMASLYIYDKITNLNISNGEKISGTGTIDENGKVGPIGGVKYKLGGAIKNKSKVFIVPSDNYEEAINIKKKNNYNIDIIEATTLDETIKKLIERK